jgi:heptosyltransferase-2
MSHPAPNPLPDKPPIGLYGGEILFASPRRWDETCFAAPALRAIRAARPSCTLGVICHEELADYWSSVSGINAIITYGNRTKLRDMLRAHSESTHAWDAAILWEKDLAAEFCKSLGVKQRIGYAVKPLAKFLTDAVPMDDTPGPVMHRVQHYLNLMESLKIPTKIAEIFTPTAWGAERDARHIVISPDSDFGPSHEWNFTAWEQTIQELFALGFSDVTVLQISTEKNPLSHQLARHFPDCRSERIGNLATALPVLARARFSICADSSICHLSAHVGTTTISLFGPNDPDWRRPLGKQHLTLREKVECSPCLMRKCPLDRRCQNELRPDAVIQAVCHLWEQTIR